MLDTGFRVVTALQKIEPPPAPGPELFPRVVMMGWSSRHSPVAQAVSFVTAMGSQHPVTACDPHVPAAPRGTGLCATVDGRPWKGEYNGNGDIYANLPVTGTEMMPVCLFCHLSSMRISICSWICGRAKCCGAGTNPFHFIHSEPTIFSLFWSPLGRNPDIRQQPGTSREFKPISSWFTISLISWEMPFPKAQ